MKAIAFVLALGFIAVQAPVVQRKPDAMGPHCLMPRPTLMGQEGNPGHKEPPPGWHCANQGPKTPADHACSCHRECVDEAGENADGTQTTTTRVKEDPKCLSYCYQDHCTCGVKNCE